MSARFILTLGISAICVLLVSSFIFLHPDEGEVLQLEYNNYDLGDRFINDMDTIPFPFKNESGHLIEIEDIRSNNKYKNNPYTIVNYKELKRPIKNNETDTIWFARRQFHQVEPKLYDCSYTIHFKDLKTKQYVNIFANLKSNRGELKSRRVEVKTVNRGDDVQFSSWIRNEGDDPVKIMSERYGSGTVDLLTDLPIKIPAKDSVKLDFLLHTQSINKFYKSNVSFSTNENDRYPSVSVSYFGELISENEPEMTFDSLVQSCGTLCQGDRLVYEFWFENTGNEPLIISNCKTSCGCLVATWPKEPIMPGERNVIKIKYDTKRVGPVNKSCTINSNIPGGVIILRVKGNIKVCDDPLIRD